jgi:hypothetical protein
MDLVVAELDRVAARIAGRFTRSEPRGRVREYLSGLVAGLERKNGWTLAEQAGEVCPDGMQRLLRRADWDVDGVRDDLRDYVVVHLGEPGGVLIVDESGFLKKGTRSAGRLVGVLLINWMRSMRFVADRLVVEGVAVSAASVMLRELGPDQRDRRPAGPWPHPTSPPHPGVGGPISVGRR